MTVRTIRVVEVRHAPSADGPWGETHVVGTDHRDQPDWCEPFHWPERGVWCINRVVPYVPESELEALRAKLQEAERRAEEAERVNAKLRERLKAEQESGDRLLLQYEQKCRDIAIEAEVSRGLGRELNKLRGDG